MSNNWIKDDHARQLEATRIKVDFEGAGRAIVAMGREISRMPRGLVGKTITKVVSNGDTLTIFTECGHYCNLVVTREDDGDWEFQGRLLSADEMIKHGLVATGVAAEYAEKKKLYEESKVEDRKASEVRRLIREYGADAIKEMLQ